jgi:hypothetical protein
MRSSTRFPRRCILVAPSGPCNSLPHDPCPCPALLPPRQCLQATRSLAACSSIPRRPASSTAAAGAMAGESQTVRGCFFNGWASRRRAAKGGRLSWRPCPACGSPSRKAECSSPANRCSQRAGPCVTTTYDNSNLRLVFSLVFSQRIGPLSLAWSSVGSACQARPAAAFLRCPPGRLRAQAVPDANARSGTCRACELSCDGSFACNPNAGCCFGRFRSTMSSTCPTSE